jgi:hypothetical protein
MKLTSFSLVAAAVGVFLAVVACSGGGGDTPKVCTPGASVACVGAGGCAGGQACSADGAGYGACVCGGNGGGNTGGGGGGGGGADASALDGSATDATSDASPTPTKGGVHVTWTLRKAGTMAALTCADVTGQNGVDVVVTKSGTTTAIENLFVCTAGLGDVLDLAFGSYTVSSTIVNAQSQGLGSAPAQVTTLAASPCDQIISGQCVKSVAMTIIVD